MWGVHTKLSFIGDLAMPYSAELPIWMNFLIFFKDKTFKRLISPRKWFLINLSPSFPNFGCIPYPPALTTYSKSILIFFFKILYFLSWEFIFANEDWYSSNRAFHLIWLLYLLNNHGSAPSKILSTSNFSLIVYFVIPWIIFIIFYTIFYRTVKNV